MPAAGIAEIKIKNRKVLFLINHRVDFCIPNKPVKAMILKSCY
jgi:hypothetical protein